jgi:hypothetical protein
LQRLGCASDSFHERRIRNSSVRILVDSVFGKDNR